VNGKNRVSDGVAQFRAFGLSANPRHSPGVASFPDFFSRTKKPRK